MSEREVEQENDDAELGAWRGEWQRLGGQDGFAKELISRAARDGRRMRRAAAGEVLGVLFSTATCAWLMVRTRGAVEVVAITVLILVFNGAWLTYFFSVRADLFSASGEGVSAFIALTRRRLATEQRWIRVARWAVVALGGVAVPWGVWTFLAHEQAYRAEPWRAVVGFGGAALILAGVLAFTWFKERRLAAEGRAFERNVADAEML